MPTELLIEWCIEHSLNLTQGSLFVEKRCPSCADCFTFCLVTPMFFACMNRETMAENEGTREGLDSRLDKQRDGHHRTLWFVGRSACRPPASWLARLAATELIPHTLVEQSVLDMQDSMCVFVNG